MAIIALLIAVIIVASAVVPRFGTDPADRVADDTGDHHR
jgi:hypothetical protein